MADNYKINFYPKPAPPTNPRVLPFEEIQRLLAQAPNPPTHEPGGAHACNKNTHIGTAHGPKKTTIQCTNRGTYQFR